MSGPGPEGGAAAAPGTLGVILLVHADLDRAGQLARHWARGGCPVVVHVDLAVPPGPFRALEASLADLVGEGRLAFSPRHRCEWGTWGIVAATLAACEAMLARHGEVGHVFLASGACLPLRPVAALVGHLAARPGVDFIESATTADVPWAVGGLSEERFTRRFPFPWRRRRRLFDAYVALQRRWGLRRRIPEGVVPHLGSQWWCLSRGTLLAILRDPERPGLERWFRRVWIPDESFFQTLARRHSATVESRSLTLSRFDVQGRPHVFYDDHLPLLRRSDCFVARKAWAGAERLFGAFLDEAGGAPAAGPSPWPAPAPGKIDRVLARAAERRTRGRPGLWMQSRFPRKTWGSGVTAAPFTVFEGFAELFEGWGPWLGRATGARVHGHLFAPGRVEFEGGAPTFAGALSDDARLRDHHPQMFLRNLLWATRGEGRQCFQFGPGDAQDASWDIAQDANATVWAISGAWLVPLFRGSIQEAPQGLDLRAEAARLQRIEAAHLDALRSPHARACVRVWTLAEVLEAPAEAIGAVLEAMGDGALREPPAVAETLAQAGGGAGSARGAAGDPSRSAGRGGLPADAPRLGDLAGFGRFLQDLRNQGMHPHLAGDVPLDGAPGPEAPLGPRLVSPGAVPGPDADDLAAPPGAPPATSPDARRPPRRPYLIR